MTATLDPSTPDTSNDDHDLLSALLRSPDYPQWRARVEASGGCARPVRLTGSSVILDRDGAVLVERAGDVFAPCGNRRESVCPACSDRYAGDAFHLLSAGLAGGDKDIPTTVADKPRVFLTLTAPSFGPVHSRRTSKSGRALPCGCRCYHHPSDPALGTPLDADGYDYVGAVLWQAHAGQLWHRFVIALRRVLAAELGVRGRDFATVARLSYAKVAEYQRRGLVHFHAVIRLDGPDGPADPCPPGITPDVLRAAVTAAAQTASITTARPDGSALALTWGAQLDLREIRADTIEDDTGQISEARLAGYIAKYATKGTGATEGTDRPIRDSAHIAYLDVSPHHRRMIETCWQLGGLDAYAELGLRRWAHMLGFRGYFLTKSQRYSTTFRAIRGERRDWRLREELEQLDRDTWGEDGTPIDLDTVTVINDWRLVGVGHRNYAEQELAMAIAERKRTHGTTTTLRRTA
jgi:hypothetical protein